MPVWADEGLFFSFLGMWGYLAVYWVTACRHTGNQGLKPAQFELPVVRPLIRCGLIVLGVACFLICMERHPVTFLATHAVRVYRACLDLLTASDDEVRALDGGSPEGTDEVLAVAAGKVGA